jgi:hypothetical protein
MPARSKRIPKSKFEKNTDPQINTMKKAIGLEIKTLRLQRIKRHGSSTATGIFLSNSGESIGCGLTTRVNRPTRSRAKTGAGKSRQGKEAQNTRGWVRVERRVRHCTEVDAVRS